MNLKKIIFFIAVVVFFNTCKDKEKNVQGFLPLLLSLSNALSSNQETSSAPSSTDVVAVQPDYILYSYDGNSLKLTGVTDAFLTEGGEPVDCTSYEISIEIKDLNKKENQEINVDCSFELELSEPNALTHNAIITVNSNKIIEFPISNGTQTLFDLIFAQSELVGYTNLTANTNYRVCKVDYNLDGCITSESQAIECKDIVSDSEGNINRTYKKGTHYQLLLTDSSGNPICQDKKILTDADEEQIEEDISVIENGNQKSTENQKKEIALKKSDFKTEAVGDYQIQYDFKVTGNNPDTRANVPNNTDVSFSIVFELLHSVSTALSFGDTNNQYENDQIGFTNKKLEVNVVQKGSGCEVVLSKYDPELSSIKVSDTVVANNLPKVFDENSRLTFIYHSFKVRIDISYKQFAIFMTNRCGNPLVGYYYTSFEQLEPDAVISYLHDYDLYQNKDIYDFLVPVPLSIFYESPVDFVKNNEIKIPIDNGKVTGTYEMHFTAKKN